MILSDSIPVWLASGALAVGAWAYGEFDDYRTHNEIMLMHHESRIAAAETHTELTQQQLNRLEDKIDRILGAQ